MLTLLTKSQLSEFPLTSVSDVVSVIRLEIAKAEPSLSLVSVLLGIVERSLTSLPRERPDWSSCVTPEHHGDTDGGRVAIPPVTVETVFVLLSKWLVMVLDTGIERGDFDSSQGTCAGLVRRVSDAVWIGLCKHYRLDLPHITSLYSLLVFGKLDCLGVALAVLAACQLLQISDVTLAISEDHYWCCHGNPDARQHTEITWHDKDGEDRRGKPVLSDVTDTSWLHSGSHPSVCDSHMQISVMVGSMSACLSSGGSSGVLRCTGGMGSSCGGDHSGELLLLQHQLLCLLQSCHRLKQLPVVLGTLADLEMAIYKNLLYSAVNECRSISVETQESKERGDGLNETSPSLGSMISSPVEANPNFNPASTPTDYPSQTVGGPRLSPGEDGFCSALNLHRLAVDVSQTLYEDRLVVPHLRLGFALLTSGRPEESIAAWSSASSALARYNYSRDDEHLYKTLLEITTVHVPRILKETDSLLGNSRVFRSLLLFYDGVCAWEEAGTTPLLHVGWAKPMAMCLAKFSAPARSSVTFRTASTDRRGTQGSPSVCSTGNSAVDCSANADGIRFLSEKMSSLSSLLTSSRINTQAVSLLLAAQSQSSCSARKQPEGEPATQRVARRVAARSRRD